MLQRIADYGQRRKPAADHWKRLGRRVRWLAPVLILAIAAWVEVRTSALQSRLFHWYATKLSYRVEPGASSQIVFPTSGPSSERLGYSRIPQFQQRLQARRFQITEQARFSPELMRWAAWGITPPYREPAERGLRIGGRDGSLLYNAAASNRLFKRFEEIPPAIVRTLLFIENRDLQEPFPPYRNPAVEWDRLAKATLLYLGNRFGLPVAVQGGSTLAVQLEKYQHSPAGRTDSVSDKLRQIAAASFRAYRQGPDAGTRTKEIILDYLNTMPLAATPRYGEILGLGNGLYAWYGADLAEISEALTSSATERQKTLRAYKQVLTLLLATRAPSYYLIHNPAALEKRVDNYIELLVHGGVIDRQFADDLRRIPAVLPSPTAAPFVPRPAGVYGKPSNAIRLQLARQLGVRTFYELDHLDLEVETEIDPSLQREVIQLFWQLEQEETLSRLGVRQDRLLLQGDPVKVLYSLLLFERTPQGNALRVQADNLDQPFDLNSGMKLELGSSAKLRTLAHYLELAASLYEVMSPLRPEVLQRDALRAADPITRWALQTLASEPGISLDAFLEKALQRTYSASPDEVFFTGGGRHTFRNFDPSDDHRVLTIREALVNSTNLVFIRLMRDLVRFHQARLPYDAEGILNQPDHPERHRLLNEIATEEARQVLHAAYQSFRNRSPRQVVERLLGTNAKSPRHLAMLFYAWRMGPDEELPPWLVRHLGSVSAAETRRLAHAYNNPRLSISDFGYLLGIHPLRLWCAGEMFRQPDISWQTLLDRSSEAQRVANAWLFQTRNRKAQDLRLRIRVEQDAFARMTPYWQRLGFPFETLVPSLATAIGNSSDRPVALAELMGIIVNGGVRRPTRMIRRLRFAAGTPYHTVFEPVPESDERVMSESVARALQKVLAAVVEHGTAQRLAGAFRDPHGSPLVVGGKTGSGDNRFETFARDGSLISSRAVNRTATFVFYIGDRYFGVVTAFVPGREAEAYRFTSALPLAILKLLAPAIQERYFHDIKRQRRPRGTATAAT
ncbi:MAG TPA: transglycosylase domain-containing protein [Terriglobia bacterium]|nr:transglycosylase domain-containing protein [Terriglobia bacterium]